MTLDEHQHLDRLLRHWLDAEVRAGWDPQGGDEPEAAAAVDPQVHSTGTPTTREKES